MPAARPHVQLNLAVTADGRAHGPAWQALPISCVADWRRVHELREQVDAVAVGARTWRREQPQLTARPAQLGRAPTRQPARVIFSGAHPCPPPGRGTPVFSVGVLPLPGATHLPSDGHDLAGPLAALYSAGVRTLLVEGGPTLLRSFLAQQLADCATVYVRGRAPWPVAVAGIAGLEERPVARALGAGTLLEWTWGTPASCSITA